MPKGPIEPPEPKTAAQEQRMHDHEANTEHSKSGSNRQSGQGMEYVTRKTHSSREWEEGTGKEEVHGTGKPSKG
ncbi:uncharacterized protein EI97DRAFT_470500 [Westerdykella ornata]|uniref:Uncharacterized protein n=1 Tax=Westerdykella ornata TaxID=318751 RepID=A0A6A6J6S3_WESOR|nr:uncharacterized protein EI97DRAFT_470500 [Westerdykella ornata]KAF2272271.1 hypothetical protein EI97DRAFT_470500 [Westerdykella ornata]